MPKRPQVIIYLSPDELELVVHWRFNNRVPSMSEAGRMLLMRAICADDGAPVAREKQRE